MTFGFNMSWAKHLKYYMYYVSCKKWINKDKPVYNIKIAKSKDGYLWQREGKVVIDKSIVGGTKIIVGDTVIDASVRGQLDNLAYTLKA